MIIRYIQRTFWFVGLVLLQVLALNHIALLGVATPFLYLYFLLKLDSETSRQEQMFWAFALGFTVDVFGDTGGLHVMASVFVAFVRTPLLRLFTPRDMLENFEPSLSALGVAPFLRYLFATIFLFCSVLFVLDFFTFTQPLMLLLHILTSTLLTVVCMVAIEGIRK